MTLSILRLHNLSRHGARRLVRLALTAAIGLGAVGLQACATSDMPAPKYPIYMQDKPTADMQPVAAAETAPPVVVEDEHAVTPPVNNGGIISSDLPPPPPPPQIVEAAPVAAAPAVVTMPAPPPVSAPVRDTGAAYVYVLQSHDTLYGLSRRFGVAVKVLYDINALPQDANLRVGQKILLPATAVDKGAEEHANGPGMTKLSSAAVATAAPPPVAPKPVTATTTTTTTTTAAVSKPPVTAPATTTKPATTVGAVTPPKPVVTTPPVTTTTTTTTTTSTKPAPPKTTPVAPPANGAFPSGTQISQMGRGNFIWPVRGKILVPFGQLAPNVRNDGINISADNGVDVVAAADGVVVYEGDQVKELGNTIYVKHPGGWYTGYSHLGTMTVKNNEKVTKGQVIGKVGQTGVIDRPQLHFEIRYTPSTDIAKPIDPNLVLP